MTVIKTYITNITSKILSQNVLLKAKYTTGNETSSKDLSQEWKDQDYEIISWKTKPMKTDCYVIQ